MEITPVVSNSLLELLYRTYDESSCFTDLTVQTAFNHLNAILAKETVHDYNCIMESVCAVCSKSQKVGFTIGMKAGFELYRELS